MFFIIRGINDALYLDLVLLGEFDRERELLLTAYWLIPLRKDIRCSSILMSDLTSC